MRLLLNTFVLAVGLLALAGPAAAQNVSLITFGPGEMTFEKFGHTALRVRDARAGYDIIYNWGLFTYKDEVELITRFVGGKLQYWMGGFDGQQTIELYRRDGRAIWEQELNFTPQQTSALLKFLAWNERPENRVYRYDYYKDNCTTRVRDAIDQALGHAVARQTRGVPTGATFRDHTRRTLASNVLLYTALQTVLGPWVDQKIDQWDESFLPFELQRHIRNVMVTDAAGNDVPLVKSETELDGGRYAMPSTAVPVYWPFYALAGSGFGGLVVATGAFAMRQRLGRLLLMALVAGWSLLAGVGGGIILFGWLFTDHIVSYRNENLLQTSPLLLAMPVLAFMGLVGTPWARRAAAWLAIVVAGLSVLGLLLKTLPWFNQVNIDIVALALPVNVALAWALWRYAPPAKSSR